MRSIYQSLGQKCFFWAMAECACGVECDTAGNWCRVAPGVFISLKFGQSIGGDKLPFPIPETQSAFRRLAQRNASHHRDARQQIQILSVTSTAFSIFTTKS